MTSSWSATPFLTCPVRKSDLHAVVVSAPHVSHDIFVVPLTSKTTSLVAGEFPLVDWGRAGLNVPTAVKRGLYTIHQDLVVKTVGRLIQRDADRLQRSLQEWLGLS